MSESNSKLKDLSVVPDLSAVEVTIGASLQNLGFTVHAGACYWEDKPLTKAQWSSDHWESGQCKEGCESALRDKLGLVASSTWADGCCVTTAVWQTHAAEQASSAWLQAAVSNAAAILGEKGTQLTNLVAALSQASRPQWEKEPWTQLALGLKQSVAGLEAGIREAFELANMALEELAGQGARDALHKALTPGPQTSLAGKPRCVEGWVVICRLVAAAVEAARLTEAHQSWQRGCRDDSTSAMWDAARGYPGAEAAPFDAAEQLATVYDSGPLLEVQQHAWDGIPAQCLLALLRKMGRMIKWTKWTSANGRRRPTSSGVPPRLPTPTGPPSLNTTLSEYTTLSHIRLSRVCDSLRDTHAVVGGFLRPEEQMHALHHLVGVMHVVVVVPARGDGSTPRLGGHTHALTVSTEGTVTSTNVTVGEDGTRGLAHYRGSGVVTIVYTHIHYLATLRSRRGRQTRQTPALVVSEVSSPITHTPLDMTAHVLSAPATASPSPHPHQHQHPHLHPHPHLPPSPPPSPSPLPHPHPHHHPHPHPRFALAEAGGG